MQFWATINKLIIAIVVLVNVSYQQSCSSYTDYSSDTVQCTSSCPPSSRTINNKCLSSKQYLIGDQVHACNGWVDSQATVCCGRQYYIGVVNGISNCLKCHGRVYMGGNLCCPGSFYADMSGTTNPRCVQMGTGQCASITMKNLMQVCCPDGLFYSIQQQKCVNPVAYNCDSVQRICCPFGKKLDNINTQIVCVDTCAWNDNSTFYCRKKYCNSYDQSQRASPTPVMLYERVTDEKIALGGSCCYGLSTSGACLNDINFCLKRFVNRGWAVCCGAGEFYSIKTGLCNMVCDGIILFQFFCIQQGSILNLQASNGQPAQSPSGTLCNSRTVSDTYPVCCPIGFYINSTQGCQLCNGRIFQTSSNQICCGYRQIYNANSGKCQPCSGIVNKQGTLCCLNSQYFGYSVNGVGNCVDTCANQKLYKAEYCCDGLGQCQSQTFSPTICSINYLSSSACQACPSFCSMDSQSCTSTPSSSSSLTQCQKSCQIGTIYSSQMQQCLACDVSCVGCTQPFNGQYCTQCKDGYVFNQGVCNRCAPQCLTCSPSISTCTSCPSNSSRPVLSNGRCMPACQIGQYFDLGTATCLTCSNGCSECTGSQAFQCSKCPISMFYSAGTCSPCSSGCTVCFSSTSRCYQCQAQSLLYLNYDTQQCVSSCQTGYSRVYDSGLGHSSCTRCHPSCMACQNSPQNCVACANSTYFMSDQTGVNLCIPCAAPCMNCQSSTVCLMCQPGFYVLDTKCQSCHQSCQTCTTGLDTGCLTCFGDSQLIQGKCVGCSSSCQQCDINQNCLVCKSPYYFYSGNCVTSCPTNSYISNNICTNCLANCSSCANVNSCITCAPLFPIVFQGLCLNVCPSGFQLQAGACVAVKNQTINNNTDYNNSNNNNTNNNNNNNGNTNNTNTNSTTITKTARVKSQTIQLSAKNNTMIITTNIDTSLINSNTTLTNAAPPQLQFYLYNTKTGAKVRLSATKLVTTQTNTPVQQVSPSTNTNSNSNNVSYQIAIPSGQSGLKNSILLTSIAGQDNYNSTTYYNAKSIWQFILYDYASNPLLGLQYIGLTFSILIGIYAIVSKLKGHFLAQQANTLILHLLNFSQVVYLFKFTRMHDQGMYHFLNGFGFMHLLMFPNMFYKIIPAGYQQYAAQKSIIPDANFIRNAGSSISFLIICILITVIVFIISYALYIKKDLQQMPQVRKITRIGILAMSVTFLNILFTALCYLIQPYITNDTGFAHSSKVAAIIMLVLIIVMCVGIVVHFYKTYNSDVLQHYYTLRQACQYIMILCQAIILAFGVGKPLVCLVLIPLQIVWFIFNYLLYRYGQGDRITHHIKFIVSTVCIIVSYLFLSLANQIHWIVIIVIVSLAVIILIIYSSYQIVGLYYSMIFRTQGTESVKQLGYNYDTPAPNSRNAVTSAQNMQNKDNIHTNTNTDHIVQTNRSRNLDRSINRSINKYSSKNVSNNNVSINNDKQSDSRL